MPLLDKPSDYCEQLLGVREAEPAGRFVQDQEPAIALREGARDRHQLLLGGTEIGGRRIGA